MSSILTSNPEQGLAASLPTPQAMRPNVKRPSGGGNKKGTPADRRATHNAVERARRESLNVRFLELAANLPATYAVRRPSKNLIVNKSIDFVRTALHNDAVLRLKLDEIMRQNQNLLQEVNQLRAERGLSPRANTNVQQHAANGVDLQPDFSSISAANLSNFSRDALNSAFRMPGVPQPLASVDFTKQVMEQNLSIDFTDVQHLFANDDEEAQSNHASTDLSGAASEKSHSSPVLTADATGGLMPSHSSLNANGAVVPPFHLQQLPQPQYDALLQPSGHGVYGARAAEVTPSYAHLAGINTQSAAATPYEYMPAMSPTTAAMFTNMLSSYAGATRPPAFAPSQHYGQQDLQGVDRSAYSTKRSPSYGQGSTFATPA